MQPAPVYVRPAPVYRNLPAAHYNWCFRKFRSYHQPSNTYQPYNGRRRQCNSPWS
ncbi:MAG: BA14K family protein [Hyphomicrobiales bacterium]|nr:BA14K family protein [Hyphomicrobiales bacterium]